MYPSRRKLLSALGLTAASLAFGSARTARGDGGSSRRFLFVFAAGGWDPLTVFSPSFDSDVIEMETGADRLNVGGFSLVDGPGRPSVRRFFEEHHSRTLLFNGVNVRSLSHDVCARIVLAGSSELDRPDWATRVGAGAAGDYAIPHLDYSGLLRAGPYSSYAARVGYGGQLDGLASGEYIDSLDASAGGLDRRAQLLVDGFLAARSDAMVASPPEGGRRLVEGQAECHRRASRLTATALSGDPALLGGLTLREQASSSIEALSRGLCRVATVTALESDWDTHGDNAFQAELFEMLFQDLAFIQDELARTDSPSGGVLADETTVVVLSEMGRTPRYNEGGGRDHWPFTSALVIGPGFVGDRVIGGFDDRFGGVGVDPATGDIDRSRASLTAADVGATLLAAAGIDASEETGGTIIEGALA